MTEAAEAAFREAIQAIEAYACNAAAESASFDWTLSKIEQDDSYSG